MTKAEEAALKAYPEQLNIVAGPYPCEPFTTDTNAVFRKAYKEGYELAEKDLGWHPSTEHPPVDEEVIVMRNILGMEDCYEVAFGHIVDQSIAIDYNGWNIPGVKYWMPMPKLPKEEER